MSRGGKRIGSGRKPGLITKTISFRITEDLYFEIKNKNIIDLNKKFVQWINNLK
jgi:hypothetical protein